MTAKEIMNFFAGFQFKSANDEEELGYHDPFATDEQNKRDKQVTLLLNAYVFAYQKKIKQTTICRYMILGLCLLIIVVFAALLFYLTFCLVKKTVTVSITDLVAFITACVSFISLIIGLLTIITKYFFPENDEQYITTIVESIQRNDLENKRENAKNNQSMNEES